VQILRELVAVRQERCANASLGLSPGRRRKAMIAKPEDLPGMKLLSHESLAENMRFRFGHPDQCFWPALSARAFFFPV